MDINPSVPFQFFHKYLYDTRFRCGVMAFFSRSLTHINHWLAIKETQRGSPSGYWFTGKATINAWVSVTQAGAPLHSHWLATRRVTAPPEMHQLKMFEILGHPHFKQLHGYKIPMNATNSPDRLNLYIFSLNLSYHSFASVHDIQQKRLLNKISVYAFTHPGGHHRVANATLSVACTCDGCATFRSPVTSLEVTLITWSPLWRSTHLPNSEIFIAWMIYAINACIKPHTSFKWIGMNKNAANKIMNKLCSDYIWFRISSTYILPFR